MGGISDMAVRTPDAGDYANIPLSVVPNVGRSMIHDAAYRQGPVQVFPFKIAQTWLPQVKTDPEAADPMPLILIIETVESIREVDETRCHNVCIEYSRNLADCSIL
jgi:hypothetical protein